MSAAGRPAHNAEAVARESIPVLPVSAWREVILDAVAGRARISALFGHPGEEGRIRLTAVLARDAASTLEVLSTEPGEAYPALTPECPQAHLFEREIAEQWAVRPEGHPWLKPVRFQRPLRDTVTAGSILRPGLAGARPSSIPDISPIMEGGAPATPIPAASCFFRMDGEEIHEVAVGPVHAGIIEPGHFRFQCHGENVFHLEISLGYQHRGVERALVGGPDARSIHYAETLAGDTTVGHATAYAQAVEGLSGCHVPARAHLLRALALELERLANHTGDLGALAADVGYLPTSAYCGRIRGDFLNLTALLCGNRFGRRLVRPGGAAFDLEPARLGEMAVRFEQAMTDVSVAVNLLWETNSVRARFEETGVVPEQAAMELGLVGPAARASGRERDVRVDFPAGAYRFIQVPVSTLSGGDVQARAYVRWLEMQRSAAFIRDVLKALAPGALRAEAGALRPDALVVSLVEGWRGEICHVALTDSAGRFRLYKVVDPSFHNWFGLALALREQPISDFPLCNKSFNLSYCGHDL